MPTKFVQNVAHKTGTSVEHAEKVWHNAKQAVKKGKRQGSWYWGKVVNTFKRMMGIKEHISFVEFKELLESDQGQNRNDHAERAMIHRIVDLNLAAGNMKGGRTEANLEKAYDFLESDWGGRLWDKHYELFKEMDPKFEGPFNRRRYGNFKREAVAWFKSWKNGRRLPDGVEPLDRLHESVALGLPRAIKVNGPFVLERWEEMSDDYTVYWRLTKLLSSEKFPIRVMFNRGRDGSVTWVVRYIAQPSKINRKVFEGDDAAELLKDPLPPFIEWVKKQLDDFRQTGIFESEALTSPTEVGRDTKRPVSGKQ